MRNKAFLIVVFITCIHIITGCKKDAPSPGIPSSGFTLSNLLYSPDRTFFQIHDTLFTVNGSVQFKNATSGVKQLVLQTSEGALATVNFNSNIQTEGTVNGAFTFRLPKSDGKYYFDIWLIDNTNVQSNKLRGYFTVNVDSSGNNWFLIPNNMGWGMNRIIAAGQNYVGVGDNEGIYFSTDALNWNYPTSGTNKNYYGLTWVNNTLFATGDSATIVQSTNGLNWNVITKGTNNFRLRSITGVANMLVTAGVDMTNNAAVILYSGNGLQWQKANLSIANSQINNLVWTGTQFIAVGYYSVSGQLKPLLLKSSNGINWSNISSLLTVNGTLSDIIITPDKIIAAGNGIVAISANGTAWTTHSIGGVNINSIAYSGKAYAGAGNGIYISTDGINWIQKYPDDPLGYVFKTITWTGKQFIAAGKLYSIMVSP